VKYTVYLRYLPIPIVLGLGVWLYYYHRAGFAWLMSGIGIGLIGGITAYALIRRQYFTIDAVPVSPNEKTKQAKGQESPVQNASQKVPENEPTGKVYIPRTPDVIEPISAAEFLTSIEVPLRRLASMKSKPAEVEKFLRVLARDHGIRQIDESISEYTDELIDRYRLDEQLGDDKKVLVWEPYWQWNDEVLFKGALRTMKNQSKKENHE